MADDNFFSRWSRRKVQAKSGDPLPPEPPAPVLAQAPAPAAPAAVAVPRPAGGVPAADAAAAPAAVSPEPAAPPEPPPTLDDAQRLTPQDDFSRFVARDVPPEVRNAAVKKLFADPHFNVMDGLDIYIDDYSKPSPLSKAQMAKMVGAQFLKLVDDPNAPKPPQQVAPVATQALPVDATPDAEATEQPAQADMHMDTTADTTAHTVVDPQIEADTALDAQPAKEGPCSNA
jgi:hypothetical protein